MEATRATLAEMGLRSEKAVPLLILWENVQESNLIPDIAGVNYLAGHQGQTNLQPLEGLQAFVDDLYVYGPLRDKDIVLVPKRKPSCTTGEEGSAKKMVSLISILVRQVWGNEDGYKNVTITGTVGKNSPSGRILETVQKIEEETGHRARRMWEKLHPNEEVAGYFVAKVDVSELPMERLQEGLPALQRLLEAMGLGLFQIDYTQDFSGTLDRQAWVRHLEDTHRFSTVLLSLAMSGVSWTTQTPWANMSVPLSKHEMAAQPAPKSTAKSSRSSRPGRCRRPLETIWNTL